MIGSIGGATFGVYMLSKAIAWLARKFGTEDNPRNAYFSVAVAWVIATIVYSLNKEGQVFGQSSAVLYGIGAILAGLIVWKRFRVSVVTVPLHTDIAPLSAPPADKP